MLRSTKQLMQALTAIYSNVCMYFPPVRSLSSQLYWLEQGGTPA